MTAKATEVMLADTLPGLAGAVRAVFDRFGGERLLKSSRDVYIKINGVGHEPNVHTSPDVLRETIVYFRERGVRTVYVMENCTQANFTRLVFHGAGYDRVCRETGAVPVYLDETPAAPMYLEGLDATIEISRFVHERLIERGSENFYLSLPKLKTHSMSQVTLSIKNQFGLVHQKSRIADHNDRLHQKFADIYRVLRPDFALVDGLVATDHGHYPAVYHTPRCVVPMNLLLGGPDPLATDVVGAALMGYGVADVKHLDLCRPLGLGEGDIERIEIVNRPLFEERKRKLSHELLDDYPPDLRVLKGRERCCDEGCRRNTENVVQMLYRDHGGRGGFTILMGKGVDKFEVRRLKGRVHIAGECAIEDHGDALLRRLGRRAVTMSPGCNDLAQTVAGLCRHMDVHPLRLSRVKLARSAALFVLAKLKGTRASVVPFL